MPSIATIGGWILLMVAAVPLTAQEFSATGPVQERPTVGQAFVPARDRQECLPHQTPPGGSSTLLFSSPPASGRTPTSMSGRTTVPYSLREDRGGPEAASRSPLIGGPAAEPMRAGTQPPLVVSPRSHVAGPPNGSQGGRGNSPWQGAAAAANVNLPGANGEPSPADGVPGPSARASFPRLSPGAASQDVVRAGYESPLHAVRRADAVEEPSVLAENATAAIPLSPPNRPLPAALPAPGGSRGAEAGPHGGLPSMVTVVGSLVVVLGVFLLFAAVVRRAVPRGSAVLPGEVVEVLGRAPLAGRQQLHLLRCGNKLLLVSVTPSGAETLTEITDPVEVDRLAGLCQQARPNSATAAFRQAFQHFGQQHAAPGFDRQKESDVDDYRLANAGVCRGSDALEDRDV